MLIGAIMITTAGYSRGAPPHQVLACAVGKEHTQASRLGTPFMAWRRASPEWNACPEESERAEAPASVRMGAMPMLKLALTSVVYTGWRPVHFLCAL